MRNCWQANDYYLINYRLYSPDNTQYYPLRFVVSIDLTDIPEHENYNDYLNNSIFSIADSFDFSSAAAAIAICNETIENYNR